MISKSSLDIVRVLAMTGVVADHFLQMSGYKLLVNTGLCWGGVCVAIFFSLSAYLFGEKWRASGLKSFEVIPFLKKRFLRIYIPLWISLIFIIALEWYANHPMDVKTIVFNYMGLSWARPFMWAGHLWYITMIVILYFVFLALSRLKLYKIPLGPWFLSIVGLSVMMVVLSGIFNSVSKVTIPLTILYAAMMFEVGDKLMSFFSRHRIFIGVCSLFFLGTWYLYIDGLFQTYKGIATVLNSISGLLLFIAVASDAQIKKESRIVGLLSSVSYELYLIHLTAIMFIRGFFPSSRSVLFYIVSIVTILISSFLLHWVSNGINNRLTQKIKC